MTPRSEGSPSRLPWRGLLQFGACLVTLLLLTGRAQWSGLGLAAVAAAVVALHLHIARTAWVLVVIGAALLGVSRTTGSGWTVALLVGIAATLVVGALLPVLTTRGVAVDIDAPSDAVRSRPVRMGIRVTGRGRGLRLDIRGVGVDPVALDAPVTGSVEAVPPRRGIVSQLVVLVTAAGPLGLVTRRSVIQVPLDPPMAVGPLPADVRVQLPAVAGSVADEAAVVIGDDPELTRSARKYVVGDPLRLVHWPATARTGDLMVRELEAPATQRLAVVVDLQGTDEEAVEDAASRAAGVAIAALRSGIPVTLCTNEVAPGREGGATVPVSRPVSSPIEVGRRLAHATAGPPGLPPEGRDVAVVRVRAHGPDERPTS